MRLEFDGNLRGLGAERLQAENKVPYKNDRDRTFCEEISIKRIVSNRTKKLKITFSLVIDCIKSTELSNDPRTFADIQI